MIDSKCPDCLSGGIKIGWQPVNLRDEEYTFVCSNLSCPRAREPWSVIISKKQPILMLGWDPREILWLARRAKARLLGFGRRILTRSKFNDPRFARVNGRWVQVDGDQEFVGKLEELQQEASR